MEITNVITQKSGNIVEVASFVLVNKYDEGYGALQKEIRDKFEEIIKEVEPYVSQRALEVAFLKRNYFNSSGENLEVSIVESKKIIKTS